MILKGLSHSTCLVVPLTSSTNKHLFRIPVGIINNKESNIVISQTAVINVIEITSSELKLSHENDNIFNFINFELKD